jgi:hypothetical protein
MAPELKIPDISAVKASNRNFFCIVTPSKAYALLVHALLSKKHAMQLTVEESLLPLLCELLPAASAGFSSHPCQLFSILYGCNYA